jgi:hypothetical protein
VSDSGIVLAVQPRFNGACPPSPARRSLSPRCAPPASKLAARGARTFGQISARKQSPAAGAAGAELLGFVALRLNAAQSHNDDVCSDGRGE